MKAMSKTIEADRCRGVLIGLAAGDRIGGPMDGRLGGNMR
jgi:hypothetical protein